MPAAQHAAPPTRPRARAWRRSPLLSLAPLVAWFWLASATPAHAYLDPGTGSMLLQSAITLLLGAGIAIKGLRTRLWRLLTGRRRGAATDADAPPPRGPRP